MPPTLCRSRALLLCRGPCPGLHVVQWSATLAKHQVLDQGVHRVVGERLWQHCIEATLVHVVWAIRWTVTNQQRLSECELLTSVLNSAHPRSTRKCFRPFTAYLALPVAATMGTCSPFSLRTRQATSPFSRICETHTHTHNSSGEKSDPPNEWHLSRQHHTHTHNTHTMTMSMNTMWYALSGSLRDRMRTA